MRKRFYQFKETRLNWSGAAHCGIFCWVPSNSSYMDLRKGELKRLRLPTMHENTGVCSFGLTADHSGCYNCLRDYRGRDCPTGYLFENGIYTLLGYNRFPGRYLKLEEIMKQK
nr:hypothetical protein [Tanacetum cinerariifolium]